MTTSVWPFMPQMDLVESLEWRTDVIKCHDAEYRLSLRPMPRIGYVCKYILDDVDYGAARELARTVGGDPVFVPDWPNATQIPTISASTVSLPIDVTYAPAYRVGGSVLVWGSNASYEVVTVSGLGSGIISISATSSGYTKPWIIPLRVGTFMQEFTGERGPHDYTEAEAVFDCVDTEDLLAADGGLVYPVYLNDSLITDQVEIINDARETNIREVETLDSQTGPIHRYHIYATPNQAAKLAWTAQNAVTLWEIRVWLHTRRGEWKQFWTSSWNGDAVVVADIHQGDSTVQIGAIGFATKYTLPTDIVITHVNGDLICGRVVSVSSGGAGIEVLHLTGVTWYKGPGHTEITFAVADIVSTCKLSLSRLDSDRIEIQHLPGRQATIAVATKEVPVYP